MNRQYSMMRQIYISSLIVIYCTTSQVQTEKDNRRPFYNIAHMANSIKEVGDFLNRGANAIETDVNFNADGSAYYVYHGSPCDCLRNCKQREDLAKYFQYIRNITSPGNEEFRQRLVLLFLDLKVSDLKNESKPEAGKSVANALLNHLWTPGSSNSQVYVLLSIGHSSDREVVEAILETLKQSTSGDTIMKRIGWDIGLNDGIREMRDMWSSLNVSGNVWIGEGDTNCFVNFRSYTRLEQRIKERNFSQVYSKAYTWTIDSPERIMNSLKLGVDGIITNSPETVVTTLQLLELPSRVRLATIEDNPFEKFVD